MYDTGQQQQPGLVLSPFWFREIKKVITRATVEGTETLWIVLNRLQTGTNLYTFIRPVEQGELQPIVKQPFSHKLLWQAGSSASF